MPFPSHTPIYSYISKTAYQFLNHLFIVISIAKVMRCEMGDLTMNSEVRFQNLSAASGGGNDHRNSRMTILPESVF